MKKILIITIILIGIPFFVVKLVKVPDKSSKEISLKYLSNITVRVKRTEGNIETVPLEEYVSGVIAGEMPVSFELEALKAQAVASRTYVLKKMESTTNNEYDVVDTTSNQVYLDTNQLKTKWQDNYTNYLNKITKAVNETSMEYLEYNGEVIDAMFFFFNQ